MTQCKLCPDVSYSFSKNSGTGPLAWHTKSKHSEHQPRQTQISTLGGTLGTFSYNRATCKTNLAKNLIQSEQSFSMVKDDAFKIILEPLIILIMSRSIGTLWSKMFKLSEEQK